MICGFFFCVCLLIMILKSLQWGQKKSVLSRVIFKEYLLCHTLNLRAHIVPWFHWEQVIYYLKQFSLCKMPNFSRCCTWMKVVRKDRGYWRAECPGLLPRPRVTQRTKSHRLTLVSTHILGKHNSSFLISQNRMSKAVILYPSNHSECLLRGLPVRYRWQGTALTLLGQMTQGVQPWPGLVHLGLGRQPEIHRMKHMRSERVRTCAHMFSPF